MPFWITPRLFLSPVLLPQTLPWPFPSLPFNRYRSLTLVERALLILSGVCVCVWMGKPPEGGHDTESVYWSCISKG